MSERTDELDASKVNVVADQVYAKPGEKISYSINVTNNEGFGISALALYYDPRLVPEQGGTENEPNFDEGEIIEIQGGGTLYEFASLNKAVSVISAGTIGEKNAAVNKEGTYITFYFTVPSDAKPGDEFPMDLRVTDWETGLYVPLSFSDVDGWVKIQEESTTSSTTTESTTTESTTTESTTTESTTTESTTTESTTTESTTTESTTTESTTTESTTTESTTTESTTTESTTTESTTTESTTTQSTTTESTTTESTTTGSSTTESTSTSSDTTSSTGSTDTQTSPKTENSDKDTGTKSKPTETNKNPNVVPTTTQAPGAKTGDAGVGVAVAALLAAAGAAVASVSKRKNH
ncbi:MAG: hypothetical protein IKQ39_04410 [Oscillospiraceae bacterium]|nr:hypothetical protein [Oscillospiraceae bacterium]